METLSSKIISVKEMMVGARYRLDGEAIKSTKEEVYMQIARHLRVEGFPTDSTPGFKGANVNDLVLFIIALIIDDFKYEQVEIQLNYLGKSRSFLRTSRREEMKNMLWLIGFQSQKQVIF